MKTAREIEYVVYFLLTVGLIFIYNSSIAHSQNIFGNPYRFFILHLGWVALGFLGFKIFSKIAYKRLVGVSSVMYVVTLVFLLFLALWGLLPCTMSTSFAPCINNANRWLVFNPSPLPKLPFIGELSFQPSELAKLAIVLFLAFKFKHLSKSVKSFSAYLLYASIYSILVLLEPNMSTAIIIFVIGSAMYVASGETLKPFIYLVPVLALLFIAFVLISPYRRERLMTYMNKTHVTSSTEEGYQVKQVKIALGSGGLFGVGFGQSRQKYTYLPEVSTDSIFAVIGEEFGFIGSFVISGAFLFLVLKALEVAKAAGTFEGKLVATGVATWLGVQFLIHMAANSGLIPYTGVPLPLISYGGSSLLFSMIAIGVLVNISRAKV